MHCHITALLLFYHFTLTHCVALHSHSLYKRNVKKHIGIIAGNKGRSEGSSFFCNSDQTAAVENAIRWMNRYAASSFNFLLDDNSKTTAAFIGWFGYGNADNADDIRREIFDPIYELGSEAKYHVSSLEKLDDTVVIGCGTYENAPTCRNYGVLAFARPGEDTIVVCPVAFLNNGYYTTDAAEEAVISAWKTQRRHLPSAGLAMLHEMTHLGGVVGGFSHWDSGEFASEDHAYRAAECISLPDGKTITNAQNYALFALEVRANVEYASKQVDLDASNKWNYAVRWLRAAVGGYGESP
ncbi:hypothetical protein LZ30DRAFT_432074 [Colletotrichum cereale]|nr:hypothetical protein LZ30DRAFT_432074 [Colletotrichum cereale]